MLPPVTLDDRLDVGGGVEHQPQPPPLHQDTRESPRHGGGVALAASNGGRRRRRESGVGRRRRKSAATGAAGILALVFLIPIRIGSSGQWIPDPYSESGSGSRRTKMTHNFWSSKPWLRIGFGSVFSLKCCIRMDPDPYQMTGGSETLIETLNLERVHFKFRKSAFILPQQKKLLCENQNYHFEILAKLI